MNAHCSESSMEIGSFLQPRIKYQYVSERLNLGMHFHPVNLSGYLQAGYCSNHF